MKYLLPLLFLSCAIEGPDASFYLFKVWEQDNMVRVSYCSEYPYVLYVGCATYQMEEETALIIKEGDRYHAEYSFTRICTPMYFRIKSSAADEILKI